MTTIHKVKSAAQAFERYQAFLNGGQLVQAKWHDTASDGRQLACGLGVLGDDVLSPQDCPAQVMPRWLAQTFPWLFDNQEPADAFAWGLNFYAELKRLNGVVPFSVVHDWQANVVQPMGIEWAERRGKDKALIESVQKLHTRALAGDTAPKAEWADTLRPALRQVYANANANANANADANANANANADTRIDTRVYDRRAVHRAG